MKNKHYLSTLAALLFAIVAGLNVHIMSKEADNKNRLLPLSFIEKLALGEKKNETPKGPEQTTRVHCQVTTVVTTTTNNNNSNSNGYNVGGNVNAGWGPISGSVNGGYNNNSSSGNSSSQTTTTTTTQDYWATKVLCMSSKGECFSFDPC